MVFCVSASAAARPLISLVVRYPFALPLATAHVHPCAVSTPQRRSTVAPTPPAAQPLKNRARDLHEAQLLSRFIKRTDGDSSNRSNLLSRFIKRTDGDSSVCKLVRGCNNKGVKGCCSKRVLQNDARRADWGGLSRAMAASAKRWLCACPAEGCGGAICAYGQEQCEVCGSVSRSCTECGRKAYQPGTQRMRCNTCGAKNPFE